MGQIRKLLPQPLNIVTSWTPLIGKPSIETEGGSVEQYYYANGASYIPSRAVTPLILHPRLHIVDRDGILPDGLQNILSVRWYHKTNSVDWTEITNRVGSTDYDATEEFSIDNSGILTCRRNVSHLGAEQLRADMEYYDRRTATSYTYRATTTLTTILKEDTRLVLSIDKPAVTTFNPLEDDALLDLSASAYLGNRKLTPGVDVKFVWYRLGRNSSIEFDDEAIEYVQLGSNGTTLRVNQLYIKNQTYRLRAILATGQLNGAGVFPSSPDPSAYADVTVNYAFPVLEAVSYSPHGCRVRIGDTAKTFKVRLVTNSKIYDDESVINANANVAWYRKTTANNASAEFLGSGASLDVDASLLRSSGNLRMSVYCEVSLLGPYQISTDGNGNAITSGGSAIVARSNNF